MPEFEIPMGFVRSVDLTSTPQSLPVEDVPKGADIAYAIMVNGFGEYRDDDKAKTELREGYGFPWAENQIIRRTAPFARTYVIKTSAQRTPHVRILYYKRAT